MFLFGSSLIYRLVMAPEGGEGGGGGTPPASTPPANDDKAEIERLKKELEEARNPKKDKNDDEDLLNKSRKKEEEEKNDKSKNKETERAIKFNLTVEQMIKDNEKLLPREFENIIKAAKGENYESESRKAKALKSAMIKSYFSVKENLESLTENQKVTIEDYLKLTPSAREEKSFEIYENIFEPSMEIMKKIKKAEEVRRSKEGFTSDSDTLNNYKDRMKERAITRYFGK